MTENRESIIDELRIAKHQINVLLKKVEGQAQELSAMREENQTLKGENQTLNKQLRWSSELMAIPNKRVKAATKLTLRRIVQDLLPTATVDQDGYASIRTKEILSGTGLADSQQRTELATLEEWGVLDRKYESGGTIMKIKVLEAALANASYIGKVSPRQTAQGGDNVGLQTIAPRAICPDCGQDATEGSHIIGQCEQGHIFFLDMKGYRLYGQASQAPDPQETEAEKAAWQQLEKEKNLANSPATLWEVEKPREKKSTVPAMVKSHKTAPQRECYRCGQHCWTWLEQDGEGWWDCGCLLLEKKGQSA